MPRLALFASVDDTRPNSTDVAWEDFCVSIAEPTYTECQPCIGHQCPAKKIQTWCPVEFAPGVTSRKRENAVAITMGVLDLDDPTPDQLAAVGLALDGFAYAAHMTHSGGYRVIVPFSEPCPASEWEHVWPALVARCNAPADQNCKDPSHVYFIPSVPVGTEYKFFTGIGKALSWRTDLDLVFTGPAHAVAVFTAGAQAQRAEILDTENNERIERGPIDLEALRRSVAAMRRGESRQLLDTILGGRKLTEHCPADVGYRDTTINRAMSLLATAPVDKAYAVETVLALVEPCIRAMDCTPEGTDHWIEKARSSYRRALGRRLENDLKSEADRAALLSVLGRNPNEVVEGSDDEWRKGLLYVVGRDGEASGLRQIGANIDLILRNDHNFNGLIRFNAVSKEIDLFGGPLADAPRASLETECANWLARSDYRLYMRSHEVGEQLLAVARRHEYDPVKDWLLSLAPKWDGVVRITDFFERYMRAESPDDLTQKLSRCFMISLVARGISPGCEVHTVPVLTGRQGVGKTRSLKILGGAYFSNTKLDLHSKEARMMASRAWLIELAELAAVRKVDVETVKSFVSQSVDDIRPPYGRVMERFPRHCVFVGTTNTDQFLYDDTGNRRFWPISVGICDVEALERDREQLLAEAVVAYQAGEKWYLPREDAERQEQMAALFMTPSLRAEQILSWFVAHNKADRPKIMTSHECAKWILQVSEQLISDNLCREIARALTILKFKRVRRRVAGKPIWYYETPPELMEVEPKSKPMPEHLEVVDGEDSGT